MGPLSVLFGILVYLAATVFADRNITIDDFDTTRIEYLPANQWTAISAPTATSDRYKMTTTFTTSYGAHASFNFSGAVAFYFMGYGGVPTSGPLGSIEVQFDGGTYEMPENINLVQQAKQILFSRTGLDANKQYTFIVRKITPDGGGHDLNVDAMIYTVPDGDVKEGVVSGDGTEDRPPIGVIVGGVVGGICSAGTLSVGIWLWLRWRRREPLEAAPYVLPLFTIGGAPPLEKNQVVVQSHSTAPIASQLPRPSVTFTSTNAVIPNMPTVLQHSSGAIPATATMFQLQAASPPPYSS